MYKLPKNIRQIGQIGGNRKIYVEDYVITFTKQLVKKEYGNYSFAILLGNYNKIEGCRNIFINGAVEVEDMVYGETINFSNDVWTNIFDCIKKYFTDSEVVGWYIGGAGLTLDIDDKILKAQKENFAGLDKVLFMYDSIEQEDAFFLSEGSNNLKKQPGYYVYYERNEEMQNYMIDRQGPKSSEQGYDDKATKEIRQVIENKKEDEDGKKAVRLLYAVSSVFAVIVLVIAATMFMNYDQLTDMQKSLETLSSNIGGKEETDNDVTEVETIVGEVSSKEENEDDEKVDVEDNSDNTDNTDVADNKSSDDAIVDDLSQDDNSDPSDDTKKSNETTDNNEQQDTDNVKNENTDVADTSDDSKDNSEKDNSEKTSSEAKNDADSKDTSEDSVPVSTSSESVEKPNQYYIVQKGDTLATISLKFYDTLDYVKKIMDLNKIEDQDHIVIGQKLVLP